AGFGGAYEERGGRGDEGSDREGRQGVADVLGEPLGDRGVTAQVPVGAVEEVAEVVQHRRRADEAHARPPTRVQGVSRRCSSTSPTSHRPASSIESTMPMMI